METLLLNEVGPKTNQHQDAFHRQFDSPKSNAENFATIAKIEWIHSNVLANDSIAVDVGDIRQAADNFAIALSEEMLYGDLHRDVDGRVPSLSNVIRVHAP